MYFGFVSPWNGCSAAWSPPSYSYQEWLTCSVICAGSRRSTFERSRLRITPGGRNSGAFGPSSSGYSP